MEVQYYTALAVDNNGKWMKYRNIRPSKTPAFEQFLKIIKQVRYINYYDKKKKAYIKRVYL